jgi:hypothetical protein
VAPLNTVDAGVRHAKLLRHGAQTQATSQQSQYRLLLGIRELGALVAGMRRVGVRESLCEAKHRPGGDANLVSDLLKALISTQERQRARCSLLMLLRCAG